MIKNKHVKNQKCSFVAIVAIFKYSSAESNFINFYIIGIGLNSKSLLQNEYYCSYISDSNIFLFVIMRSIEWDEKIKKIMRGWEEIWEKLQRENSAHEIHRRNWIDIAGAKFPLKSRAMELRK